MFVYIDDDTALDMLMERVYYWTDDNDVRMLFEKYYEQMIFEGVFNGGDFDVMGIVDNDYVNYTSVYSKEDIDIEGINTDRILSEYNGYCLVALQILKFDFDQTGGYYESVYY